MNKMPLSNRLFMLLGFFFLYAPILSLVIFSFNESRLVTVWGGFSLKWYGEMFRNDSLLSAAGLSFKIAFLAATLAVVLGTVAGFVLARFGRFKGKSLFAGLTTAPMVMPEVIVGLSMLLLFVSLQSSLGCSVEDPQGLVGRLGCWAFGERGMITIWIGHTTLCMAYVAVLVQSRLKELDRSLEDAAMDLGCHPFKVFFVITIPVIAPALVSGWLLSFTLSLDDYVLTAFLSGPGSTTMPQWIFSSVRIGPTPEVNALATVIIVVVTVFVVISNRLMLSAQARRDKAMQAAFAGKH
ncbi:ABC transporter permease subunit [Chitinimonas taiwanensis]|jgi:putrescine transport system permease protein|uniref:Putrescine transport system permease protein n=1 Tax=Chitinimonas taiwanensis DSM 18899 TaxID=1121279 RepID=A0A1K2HKE2_9NEIS|nr:ABC transporter permease subunit [Chitinimonas taiwanensis]SFZ76730.1 putrescine transport system permease protein [Chitinimonas taiwanensis DSM 18899]